MSVVLERGHEALAVVLGLIGIAAVIGGIGYGVTVEGGEVGPGALPAACGLLLLLCAVADGVSHFRHRRGNADEPLLPEHFDGSPALGAEDAERIDVDVLGRTQQQRNRMLAAVMALILGATILVYLVGFIIAFAVLLLSISVLVERRRLLPAAAVSVGVLGVVYGVFAIFLSVPFPTGLLGLI